MENTNSKDRLNKSVQDIQKTRDFIQHYHLRDDNPQNSTTQNTSDNSHFSPSFQEQLSSGSLRRYREYKQSQKGNLEIAKKDIREPLSREVITQKTFQNFEAFHQAYEPVHMVSETSPHPKEHIWKKFNKIGGKTELENAEIIGLGNHHEIDKHKKVISNFINSIAQDGDIVLLEAAQSGESIDTKTDTFMKSISKKIKCYGWDDELLHTTVGNNFKKLAQIEIKAEDYKKSGDVKNHNILAEMHKNLYDETVDIAIKQRNESMIKTINNMRKKFPNRRIFVIAGTLHFTDDPTLKNKLEQQLYIALEPTTDKTEEEDADEKYAKGLYAST